MQLVIGTIWSLRIWPGKSFWEPSCEKLQGSVDWMIRARFRVSSNWIIICWCRYAYQSTATSTPNFTGLPAASTGSGLTFNGGFTHCNLPPQKRSIPAPHCTCARRSQLLDRGKNNNPLSSSRVPVASRVQRQFEVQRIRESTNERTVN